MADTSTLSLSLLFGSEEVYGGRKVFSVLSKLNFESVLDRYCGGWAWHRSRKPSSSSLLWWSKVWTLFVLLVFDLRVYSLFEVFESSLILDFAVDDHLKATFKVWICTVLVSIWFSSWQVSIFFFFFLNSQSWWNLFFFFEYLLFLNLICLIFFFVVVLGLGLCFVYACWDPCFSEIGDFHPKNGQCGNWFF